MYVNVTYEFIWVLDHDVSVELLQLLVQLLDLLVGLLQHVVNVGQALLVRGHLTQVLRSLLDLELLADLAADLLLDFVQLLLHHGVRQVQVVAQAQPLGNQLAPGITLGE